MPLPAEITSYEQALLATEGFLRRMGEEHWANWLQQDLAAWRERRDVSHHRSAYGGMGSFNDVYICPANTHRLTNEQVPWANALFVWLKALLHYLSQRPTERPTASALRNAVGSRVPSLSAFVGGERAPDSMRGFAAGRIELTGARCLACGYGELTQADIDSVIAGELVADLVFQACEHGTLPDAVDRVLKLDVPAVAEWRQQLRAAATASGIHLIDTDRSMRHCPKCQSDDTATYRWDFVGSGPPRLKPALDNLPLRKSAKTARRGHRPPQQRAGAARIISLVRKLLGGGN